MDLRRRAQRRPREEITGITMSEQSLKRPKTTALASAGVPAIDCLPPELLETMCGFLDVRTLCTARLVCSKFHGAASRCIHSVQLSVETLRSRPETTLNTFPNLSQVSVFDLKQDDLQMLAQSPVADAVTHLRAVEYLRPVPQHAQNAPDLPLPPLPNLWSLTVGRGRNSFFPFPQTLRELAVTAPVSFRTADVVTRLTNLTCLRIKVPDEPFEAVTALTALQKLEISGELSLIPFVAELTLLTHLQFQGLYMVASLFVLPPLAPLSRLRRLVHLGLTHWHASLEAETLLLASIATLTSLQSLHLGWGRRPDRSGFETVSMTPFSQLTALRLESRFLHASFLPRFNLERLQDLSLSCGVELDLDRDAVAALRRATGLTHLRLCTTTAGVSVGPEGLESALSHMSQLRALSLGAPDADHATLPLKGIGLLTELTRLELSGRGLTTNADVDVCCGLKKLRVLTISVPDSSSPPSDPITQETFFALAKLPELHKFDIIGNVGVSGADLSDYVSGWFNAERHDKGWPPLDLSFHASIYSLGF